MIASMRTLLISVLSIAVAGLSAYAQDAPVQGPTFRTGVDLIAVDVAVVDRRGNPVEDLRAPEFSVKIDGEVRRVVTAELVKVDVEAARRQVADKSETFYTSNLTPPNGRMIIIAVDQVNIRPGTVRPVMEAAAKFLDKLSPLDQVAFVAYPEPGPRVSFTRDKIRLRTAMRSLIGSQGSDIPSEYNIGVVEALSIDNQGSEVSITTVVNRECAGLVGRDREQCRENIVALARQIATRARQAADESLNGLRVLLERLALVDGPKSLILISEGLGVTDDGDLRSIVTLAGRARTAINVLQVDVRRGDVTISQQPPTDQEDRRLQVQGLEGLAMMSRGALYRIAGTGELIFDRLASEMSAYYMLGVEQRPSDAQGDRHRIDVEVRRQNVTIRSRQAFVTSPTANARRPAEDNLRDALSSPFAVSGLPLRVTTFASQSPSGDKVRLAIAAQIGQPGTAGGDYTVGYLLVDDENRIVSSWGDKRTLAPGAGPNEPLAFVGGADVDPGIYSLRFAAVDSQGRRGSVVRDVNAWKMKDEELAMGDLIVGDLPAGGQGLRVSVEPHVSTDTIAAYIELYSTTAATWDGAKVTFEIADDPDAPSLAAMTAQMSDGRQPAWRVATGVLAARMLPPGRYVARAQITRGGKVVGVLSRPFVLERPSAAAAAPIVAPVAVTAATVSFANSLPRFDKAAAVSGDLLRTMLDIVERRSPSLKDAVTEARAGRYGPAALEALTAGDQATASFLRGMDFFMKGQLDQAAVQFDLAAGIRREFFPAAFYLGAVFAAVGRDRDAAGTWQLALGTEPRPTAVYLMVADARLRDGQAESAIDILKPAYAREPANRELARRLGTAYMLTSRYAEAVPVLDSFIAAQPGDPEALLASIVAHYELVRAGQVLSNVDRAKLRTYTAAYRGPHEALVEKYLTTMEVR